MGVAVEVGVSDGVGVFDEGGDEVDVTNTVGVAVMVGAQAVSIKAEARMRKAKFFIMNSETLIIEM